MNEKHYQRVLNHLTTWQPTRINRVFTVSNIMDITDVEAIVNGEKNVEFMEAYEIYERLKKENRLPKGVERI